MCFPLLESNRKLSPAASVHVCDLRAKPERAGAERWCMSFFRAFFPHSMAFQSSLPHGSTWKSEELDVTSDAGRRWAESQWERRANTAGRNALGC